MCLVPERSGTADFALRFPAHPVWVRNARQAMRTALTSVVPANPELIETAVLLTSEVVSNAVRASLGCRTPPPVDVHACWSPEGDLQVQVHDRAPGDPAVPERPPPTERESGRGLLLVTRCARRLEVCHHVPGPGKTVWFQL
ncbi:ATP-binding protein [Streptomyces radicis]|uniref:ATP-binding protein n=1 Tax=Streptomyces radicis TaxID=1750517 RepID=A0A3A9WA92_9ACTN|nr:ATP-binding protein [Streptomyces radicis]RKN10038.1 ATP-binding protein [Streptomyces radicis]RKN24379.1 ATP-binding protein [Streptomyces radicis]